jgi:DNA-binding MarR family transcriptional regulator
VSRRERAGRLGRAPAKDDRRRRVVSLTAKRRRLLGAVEQRSNERKDALAAHLRPSQVKELLEAMETIRRLLTPAGAS